MFCSQCGAKQADGAQFCTNCGSPIANRDGARPLVSAPAPVGGSSPAGLNAKAGGAPQGFDPRVATGSIPMVNRSNAQRAKQPKTGLAAEFTSTQMVTRYFDMDYNHQIIRICNGFIDLVRGKYTYLRFSDVMSYEVVENPGIKKGTPIRNALIGLIIGGMISFWAVGVWPHYAVAFTLAAAVIGALTAKDRPVYGPMYIAIALRSTTTPMVTCPLIQCQVGAGSLTHTSALKLAKTITAALDNAVEYAKKHR